MIRLAAAVLTPVRVSALILVLICAGGVAADPVLTVTGAIAGGAPVAFDREALAALPTVTVRTRTVWTTGVQSFTGVPLAALMRAVGATGSEIEARALNDYAVVIPRSGWTEPGPVVAYLHDGRPMSVRDKGPLWIVYPFDSDPAFRTETIYARSIWQLDRIDVRR